MKSNYIDLVVAQTERCAPSVLMLPAWSPVKPNDIILDEDNESYTVLIKTTVEPHSDSYDAILAAAGQGKPYNATAYCRRYKVVWEEEEPDESAAE